MNIHYRRASFVIIIVVFLIFAPILIFYSIGWRYDFHDRQITQVGFLVVATEPKGATVSLNERIQTTKTPLKINSILPGSYEIEIRKDTFFTWKQSIEIKPRKSTKLSEIFLIKKPPQNYGWQLSDINNYYLSPDENQILLLNDASFSLWNTKNNIISQTQEIGSAENKIVNVFWSNDSKYILFQVEDDYLIYNCIDKTFLKFSDIVDTTKYTKLIFINWSYSENDVIFFETNLGLHRFNIFQKTNTLLFENNKYLFSSNDAYFLINDNMISIHDDSDKKIIEPFSISSTSDIKIDFLTDNIIYILNKNDEQLFLYNTQTNYIDSIDKNTSEISYDAITKTALIFNSHEIWLWDLDTNEIALILRTSNTIQHAQLALGNNYVLYSTEDNGLIATELASTQKNSYDFGLKNIQKISTTDGNTKTYCLADSNFYFFEL